MNDNIIEIIKILKKLYSEAKCSLNFNNPFELLVSVVLSAQCTDERVNKITPKLFKDYPTANDFANMSLETLETYIKPCGFYKTKAKNLKLTSEILVNKFSSTVPNTIDELISLPGVGKKSANVIMLEAFNNPQGIAVDTHVKRISHRLNLSNNTNPLKIEEDLLKIIPKRYIKDVNHLFIWHGRNLCTARSPKCKICPLNKYCPNSIDK